MQLIYVFVLAYAETKFLHDVAHMTHFFYIIAEDRLKKLSDDLKHTEEKLLRATKDLKNIGDTAVQDKEDRKQQIRQKLARKMQTVTLQ